MGTRVDDALWTLTEKEKETLRLIVRGHDAKSVARSLGLSVHTINERLREARRKMAVPSSREAARLLLEAEGGAAIPYSVGDTPIGADARPAASEAGDAPTGGAARPIRRVFLVAGALVMTLILAALALTAQPSVPAAEPVDPQVVAAAERFLVLVDQSKWDESYAAFGRSFHKINTAKVWASTSEKVRVPLGAVVSRTLIGQENLPAPPHGYEVVKFRTRFANRSGDVVETVSLDKEDGVWRVVGITVG